jgi:hypothetical protein
MTDELHEKIVSVVEETKQLAFSIDRLEKRRDVTKADLLAKFEFEDWHGVMDCAADLREIDTEIKVRSGG